MDAVEQAALGLAHTLEEGAARRSSRCGGAGGNHRETDGLAFGVLAVEFLDRVAGVARVSVDYVGCSRAAIGAVVDEVGRDDGTDALEEVLQRLARRRSFGAVATYVEVVLGDLVVDVVDLDLVAGSAK